ncbi:MAG: hypothetical protein JWL70_997 [Acidimicrobiia bacterium]|nr:hypothetical protein [Acidimicrobiia bacterium]
MKGVTVRRDGLKGARNRLRFEVPIPEDGTAIEVWANAPGGAAVSVRACAGRSGPTPFSPNTCDLTGAGGSVVFAKP